MRDKIVKAIMLWLLRIGRQRLRVQLIERPRNGFSVQEGNKKRREYLVITMRQNQWLFYHRRYRTSPLSRSASEIPLRKRKEALLSRQHICTSQSS